jgi:hypothetical protein
VPRSDSPRIDTDVRPPSARPNQQLSVTDGSLGIDPLHDVRKQKQNLGLGNGHILHDQYTDPFLNEERWGYSVLGSWSGYLQKWLKVADLV